MAKEGFSNLLGAKWVINRQSWTNSLVLLKSAENCCFAPILDHAYYWLKCQVEVSGQECGTLLGVGAESVVVSPANKTSCSGVRWGAWVNTCPSSKTTSRPFEGRLPASPRGGQAGGLEERDHLDRTKTFQAVIANSIEQL